MKTVAPTLCGLQRKQVIAANAAPLPKRTLDTLTKWSESKQIRGQL